MVISFFILKSSQFYILFVVLCFSLCPLCFGKKKLTCAKAISVFNNTMSIWEVVEWRVSHHTHRYGQILDNIYYVKSDTSYFPIVDWNPAYLFFTHTHFFTHQLHMSSTVTIYSTFSLITKFVWNWYTLFNFLFYLLV